MKVLVDTHALLWFAEGNPQFPASVRVLLDDPVRSALLLSTASCWEITVKISVGKLTIRPSYHRFIRRALRTGGFRLLPIRLIHTDIIATLPLCHRDPFDRMLIAQAIAEDIPIVSGDAAFDAYAVQRLW